MLENTWHPNKTPFNKMVYTLGKGNTRIAISNLTVIDSIAKKKNKTIDQFIEIKLTKQWQSEITTFAS